MYHKILSIILLACFSASNISFAAEINSFKLATPSKLIDSEFKEAAQVLIATRQALKTLEEFNLASIRLLGQRAIKERSVFTSLAGAIYFDTAEALGMEIQGRRVFIEENSCIIRAQMAGKPYYVLVSKNTEGKGYSMTVVSERILAEALRNRTVKFTHELLTGEDRAVLNRYIEHEIETEENNNPIDPWIATRMANGHYAVDDIISQTKDRYKNAERKYKNQNYINLLLKISGSMQSIRIPKDRVATIIFEMMGRPLVLIPYDNTEELPVMRVGGQNIKVTSHSSEYATYVFVDRYLCDGIKEGDRWASDLNDIVEKSLIHEIGARCGLDIEAIEGDRPLNALDLGIRQGAASKYAARLESIAPINLNLKLRERKDYAWGLSPKAKFGVLAGLVALAGGAVAVETYLNEGRPDKIRPPYSTPVVIGTDTSRSIDELIKDLKGQGEIKDFLAKIIAIKQLVMQVEASGSRADERVVDAIVGALEDESEDVRLVAVDAFGELGDPRGISHLIRFLRLNAGTAGGIRAGRALAEIGDMSVIPSLTGLLYDDNVRPDVIETLKLMGQPAVDFLVAKLTASKYAHELITFAAVLGDMGQVAKSAIGPLKVLADTSKNQDVIDAAREAVEKIEREDPILPSRPDRSLADSAVLPNMATLTMARGAGLSVKYEGPGEAEIRAIASKIKDSGVEIFLPRHQFQGDTVIRYKDIVEGIGGTLRIYQSVDDLGGMLINPDRSIVMTSGLTPSEMSYVAGLRLIHGKARFMNFEKMNLDKMTKLQIDNYHAETLAILLVARIITASDFEDKGNPTYRMLAHLLEAHIAPAEIDDYIQDLVNNSVNLIKKVLKALPIAVYEVMKPAVQVLWSV